MYFGMLKVLFYPQDCYYIYLDIKDSNSGGKVAKPTIFFAITLTILERQIIERVQRFGPMKVINSN